MKLFFALWPDAAVRAQLDEWARCLHAACGGRRMRAENLHLTVAFIGNVEDARAAAIERAADTVRARPFALALDQPGYWKDNRIAWAGASAVPAGLEALVTGLRGALDAQAIAFDHKPFVSHVTLLRDARKPAAMPRLEAIPWNVDGFALVESRAGTEGSGYRVRKVWKAGRAGEVTNADPFR